jgi:hypothetical protein
VSVKDAVLHPQYQHIETLELYLDLEYSGGFQLSIDANMVLGKAAYLSVKGMFVIYSKSKFYVYLFRFLYPILLDTPYYYESVSETFHSPSSVGTDIQFSLGHLKIQCISYFMI